MMSGKMLNANGVYFNKALKHVLAIIKKFDFNYRL